MCIMCVYFTMITVIVDWKGLGGRSHIILLTRGRGVGRDFVILYYNREGGDT